MHENPLEPREFMPAAGHSWLLPFYDPLTTLLGTGAAHRQLIEQAKLTTGQRVLDVGCGTGNLTLLVKALHPDVEVVGLDPDQEALDRSVAKAKRRRLSVRFGRAFADGLPEPDHHYDGVFSAFMFHHLKRDEKLASLEEMRRVLKPGGRLHGLDFAPADAPANAPADASTPAGVSVHGLIARLFHRHEDSASEPEPSLIDLIREAGFAGAAEVGERRSRIGRIAYYRAVSVG